MPHADPSARFDPRTVAQLDAAWGDPASWTEHGLQWTHLSTVKARIAQAVSGDPAVHPLQWFFQRVAAERPFWVPGTRHGYHGHTYAWTLGGLFRRAVGVPARVGVARKQADGTGRADLEDHALQRRCVQGARIVGDQARDAKIQKCWDGIQLSGQVGKNCDVACGRGLQDALERVRVDVSGTIHGECFRAAEGDFVDWPRDLRARVFNPAQGAHHAIRLNSSNGCIVAVAHIQGA